ncbi:MAG: N-acetylmuramoyl-L-alanine amidase [bacterium]
MKTNWIESPNYGDRDSDVDTVVIHYTALPLKETIEKFRDRDSGASAHYVIDRHGAIIQMVKDEDKAWHAGESEFGGRTDVNDFSIGIELVNWGLLRQKGSRFYVWKNEWSQPYEGQMPILSDRGYWEPYSQEQYDSLAELLKAILTRHPSIRRERIKGHCDVCLPRARKVDPGDAFDWEMVLEAVFR